MSDSNFYSWPNYSDRDQRAFDFYKKATDRLPTFPLHEDIAICLCKSSGDLICYVFVGGFQNDWKVTRSFLENAGCSINQMEDGNSISNRTVKAIPQNLAAAGFVPIACKARISAHVWELQAMPPVKIIEKECDTLREARDQIKSEVRVGFSSKHIISETILSDETPKTTRASADTSEAAFAKAQNEIPTNANIVEKKVVAAPEQTILTIDALDEQQLKTQISSKFGERAIITEQKVITVGRKGFFGIGITPNQYQVHVLQPAIAEITYTTKAKISVEVID